MTGVPYARRSEDGRSATCPVCGATIALIERKDFESMSGAEYARHYTAAHGIEVREILPGTPEWDESEKMLERQRRNGA
jgi:rubredoxin